MVRVAEVVVGPDRVPHGGVVLDVDRRPPGVGHGVEGRQTEETLSPVTTFTGGPRLHPVLRHSAPVSRVTDEGQETLPRAVFVRRL